MKSSKMKAEKSDYGITEALLSTAKIKKIYNFASRFYFLLSLFETKLLLRGVDTAAIKSDDKVLEVAVGPGATYLEILRKVGPNNIVYGVDISAAMLAKTKKRANKRGYSNYDLREADARKLPFPDNSFDVLFNGYMLDLIPLPDIPVILNEFYRVLKEGGKMVLICYSKPDKAPTFSEHLYRLAPSLWLGCRPVLTETLVRQAGFKNVKREYKKPLLALPTEIVTGLK